MLKFKLSLDVLGNTRFAYSPLAEAASSIRLLGAPQMAHIHQPWVREVRIPLDDVDVALLCAVAPPGRWAPGFLFLPATSPHTTIEEQLQLLIDLPVSDVRRDLETIWSGRAVPRCAQTLLDAGREGIQRLGDVIWDYWQIAIEPYWPRICAVLEDDVAYRASHALAGGLFQLLSDLHPEVSLSSDLLHIDKPHHADATYDGAELTLIPSVFTFPNLIVGHDDGGKFSLTYAARGVGRVWEGISRRDTHEDQLGALLGRTRAAILTRLAVPMSTTQLARELNQSPGTISQHLAILRDSAMVISWRSGRHVLYRQTPLAASILAANTTEKRRGSA
jgi:DNA-binding transcriptional ArsR family regulator